MRDSDVATRKNNRFKMIGNTSSVPTNLPVHIMAIHCQFASTSRENKGISLSRQVDSELFYCYRARIQSDYS